MIKFKTENLIFREFVENDFENFHKLFSDTNVMKYALADVFKTADESKKNFETILSNNKKTAERKTYEFAVLINEKFCAFADITIKNQNRESGAAEIGYFILPEYWGKGIGSETAKALIDYSFQILKMHKVYAACNAENKASEKIMQNSGMIKEGLIRKVRLKNNKWHDELIYGILISEWSGNSGFYLK